MANEKNDWIKIRDEYETTNITLADIAGKYDIKYPTIKSRKQRQGWEKDASKNATSIKKDASKNATSIKKDASKKKRGAPKGNLNATGNIGGHGAPIGNTHTLKHGFFSRIFPNDPETNLIIKSIDAMSPIEMLWQNIVIQYTAIARAQRIMFVQDKDDQTKVLSKQKQSDGDTSSSWEKQWEIQHAWDKQASFMQAQSRAMTTLQGMISKYDEMMQKDMATEEQQLRINKLKAEITKLTGDSVDAEDIPKFVDDIGVPDGD